jgi:hypothetical protein
MVENKREELGIFVERHIQFMNLWTVYNDLLSGRYVPSLDNEDWPVKITMMLMLYGYFYSLVEDFEEGMNAFRVLREKFPEEEVAIATVESQIVPFRSRLRVFRNRLGFHGSRTRAHESHAFDLFAEHTGTEIWNAMENFKGLVAALLAKANAKQGIGTLNQGQIRQWIDKISERARHAG